MRAASAAEAQQAALLQLRVELRLHGQRVVGVHLRQAVGAAGPPARACKQGDSQAAGGAGPAGRGGQASRCVTSGGSSLK